MSERLTTWLGWLTLIAVLGALWVLFGEDPTKNPGARGGLLFEDLNDRIGDVSEIRVTGPGDGERVTLVKGEAGWHVIERGAYPADSAQVGRLLRGLVRSQRRDPKTGNTDRFSEIGLGSEATRLSLLDDNAQELAALDLGHYRGISSERSLTFVFKPGDSRAWVVDSLAEVSADPVNWLQRGLITLEPSAIRRVRLGDLVLVRGEDGTFVPGGDGTEDGGDLAPDYIRAAPARALARLDFDDVATFDLPEEDPARQVALTTDRGYHITIQVWPREGATWVSLSAEVRARKDGSPATEEVNEEVERFNRRVSGYRYRLSADDADILMQSRADFLQSDGDNEVNES